MLILVWFERSLHSAQVSEESCPWPLKRMTSQWVERTWIRTGGSGANGLIGGRYWKSAILSTGLQICQHEDIWPIRAWCQNMVSWKDGIKGLSQVSATLFPSTGNRLARFARQYFSYFTIFLTCGDTWVPRVITGTRICKLVTHSLIVKGHQVEANPNSKVWWSIISEEARARPSSVWSNS